MLRADKEGATFLSGIMGAFVRKNTVISYQPSDMRNRLLVYIPYAEIARPVFAGV
jgi:hypothetical protein